MSDVWLRRPVPRPDAALRLVCFPHAGASAGAYRSWAGLLPPGIEVVAVQYPGRMDRHREPLLRDMADMVAGVGDELKVLAERPFALFGHSMGAAVAYETALRLDSAHLVRLMVSARRPPGSGPGPEPGIGLSPEEALARYGNTPAAVLDDPELRRMTLDVLGADRELLASYVPSGGRVGAPITALLGDRDPDVTAAEAAGWAACTRGGFTLVEFPGDHFYLVSERARLLATVIEQLS